LLDVDKLCLGLLDDQLQSELFGERLEIVHSTMQAPMGGAK